jgi:hypothetical protein
MAAAIEGPAGDLYAPAVLSEFLFASGSFPVMASASGDSTLTALMEFTSDCLVFSWRRETAVKARQWAEILSVSTGRISQLICAVRPYAQIARVK